MKTNKMTVKLAVDYLGFNYIGLNQKHKRVIE